MHHGDREAAHRGVTSWADEVGETRSFPRWVGASASTLAGLNISCDEKVYTP